MSGDGTEAKKLSTLQDLLEPLKYRNHFLKILSQALHIIF